MDQPLGQVWRSVYEIFRALGRRAVEHRAGGLAAEIAFFGMLSIFPGLILLAAALGSLEIFLGSDFAAESELVVTDFLHRVLTEEAEGTIEAVSGLFESTGGGIATFASLAALYGLSRAFAAVIRALALAYDTGEARPWWKLRLMAIGLALVSVILAAIVLGVLVIGPLLGGGQRVADLIGLGPAFAFLWDYIRWPVAFAVLIAWAAGLYHLIPQKRSPWREDVPGAILAATAWIVASLGLSLYLRLAGDANPVFGVLGGGLSLLIWLYLLGGALVLGAELNQVLADRRAVIHPFGGVTSNEEQARRDGEERTGGET